MADGFNAPGVVKAFRDFFGGCLAAGGESAAYFWACLAGP